MLRTHPLYRALLSGTALFFAAGFLVALATRLGGGDTAGAPLVLLVVVGLLAPAAVVGAVSSFTAKVWVDHERAELHQVVGVSTVTRSLAAPTTVALHHTPRAPGSTLDEKWKVVVRSSGEAALSVGTPWVSDIRDVLRLLQPHLAHNPGLAADDTTAAALADPTHLPGR